MADAQLKLNKKLVKLTAFGRDVTVTNNVRNELNGLRRSTEVVYSENQDGSRGKPYYPRQFPVGTWLILDIVPHPATEPYLYPFFIRTSAHQTVEIRSLKPDGSYGDVAGKVEDYGYGIHFSSSSTTLGCLKVTKQEDLLWLVQQIRQAKIEGKAVTMEVS